VSINPSDEKRHVASTNRWWAESWRFDLVDQSGLGMFVEYTLLPAQRSCWFWAAVVRPGEPVVLCRELEVPFPSSSVLEIRSGALWSHAICESPLSHWTVAMEAFALALDSPEDAWENEIGHRVGLAFDLEWEAFAPLKSLTNGDDSYSLEAVVHGDLQLDTERWDVEGQGMWTHRWGIANERWFEPLTCAGHAADSLAVCWMIDGPTGAYRAARHLLNNRWCNGNSAAERIPSK
jgi:hypothetical protein